MRLQGKFEIYYSWEWKSKSCHTRLLPLILNVRSRALNWNPNLNPATKRRNLGEAVWGSRSFLWGLKLYGKANMSTMNSANVEPSMASCFVFSGRNRPTSSSHNFNLVYVFEWDRLVWPPSASAERFAVNIKAMKKCGNVSCGPVTKQSIRVSRWASRSECPNIYDSIQTPYLQRY